MGINRYVYGYDGGTQYYSIILLSKEVREILDDYDLCVEKGNIHWEYQYQNLEEKKDSKGSVLRKGLSTTILK